MADTNGTDMYIKFWDGTGCTTVLVAAQSYFAYITSGHDTVA
jgi:hypothetical protein